LSRDRRDTNLDEGGTAAMPSAAFPHPFPIGDTAASILIPLPHRTEQ